MKTALECLQVLLDDNEDEHLEFKEAKHNFHFDKLVKYCAAFANEGGGKMVLGVADAKPRKRGLDRSTNRALLLKHIHESRSAGARFLEFTQVLPSLSRKQIQSILHELKSERKVKLIGKNKGARWFAVDGSI
jgi:predicted HTH transcriptional regulator